MPRASSANAPAPRVETRLTKRVRKLYEDSAVPVREIAAIAGVTERTLYTYVEKHNWKRRYRVVARDEAVARANRGRRLEPLPDFAPVKGAGARFIRREDKDKPVAVGLKATDPAGHRQAVVRCNGAEHLSALARAKAEEAQRFELRMTAMDTTHLALKNLREHCERRARAGRPAKGDRIEPILMQVVEASLKHWEALLPAANGRG